MVATGYDSPHGPYSRSLQFLRLALWEPSCANVTCPSAMQDGAARLLQLHLTDPGRASRLDPAQRRVFEDAYRRLTSRDPAVAWTSGQWMTERTGGSDVSLTETTAVRRPADEPAPPASDEGSIPLGPWSISGFKWFSSATDSNMTVLLARTAKGGLSAFMAPMRRPDPQPATSTGLPSPAGTALNGVRIQRLKSKVGTRPLPTAELVLEDMRAWMVGDEGRGIQEISTVLNITRVHSAVAAAAYAARGLDIARAFARVRDIGAGRGRRIKLAESPLHVHTLARMTAEHRGLMLLAFLTSHVLGVSEHQPPAAGPGGAADVPAALLALTPDPAQTQPLLRVLTQITKAYVCKGSLALVFSCMESLGGVGYLDNSEQEYVNISRIWRDCAVLPIWEGTTDVLSTDLVRALKHPRTGGDSLDALEGLISKAAGFAARRDGRAAGWDALGRWRAVRARVAAGSQDDLMGQARDVLWEVAQILVSVLLDVDASSDGDAVARDIAARFVRDTFSPAGAAQEAPNPRDMLQRDLAIVYGAAGAASATARL